MDYGNFRNIFILSHLNFVTLNSANWFEDMRLGTIDKKLLMESIAHFKGRLVNKQVGEGGRRIEGKTMSEPLQHIDNLYVKTSCSRVYSQIIVIYY